jgi:hypothetical protein
MSPYPWCVLAVQDDDRSRYVAFLPLVRRDARAGRLNLIRSLHLGGRPLAFYTGFVCLPEHAEYALAACARYLQEKSDWDNFQLEDVVDPRLDAFLAHFPPERFDVRHFPSMPSLYIPLPCTWEEYLQDCIGSKTRKSLRRALRKIESDGLHITECQPDSIDRDIEVLLRLWQWRWGPKPMALWHRRMLRHFFENETLWLQVLWHGSVPVAARAGLLDHSRKTFYAYIICHDPAYAYLSPGRAMVGYSIQAAIESGFQTYDFLTGADEHKLSFGAVQRPLYSASIGRRTPRSRLANRVADQGRSLAGRIKKVLGNLKRAGFVKKAWFWSLDLARRLRRRMPASGNHLC